MSICSVHSVLRVAAPIVVGVHYAFGQSPLPIPPVLSGAQISLTLQEGAWEFHPGETVSTYGYNGDLLGPTIVLERGQEVTLNVTNTLPDLTTTHWHGLHVSPENDGGPHSLILPNTTWSPSFTVLDRASTYWYHPHGHGLTDYQVSMGAAGMIIVHDESEAALPLPRTYGVDDVPLIIQAKSIMDGQIMLHTGLDSVITVNGVARPVGQLPAQVVRFRCLNGASERTFLLGFTGDRPFHVIGTDGGLLDEPVQRTRLRLMPGERAELLVDLSGMEGSDFQLIAFNSELPNGIIGSPQVGNGMATLDGYDDNALNGADHAIVRFDVTEPTADAILAIPSTLLPLALLDASAATVVRTFNIAPQGTAPMEMIEGPFTMNDALMDMDVINETVELGATEIWVFENNSMVGHPIHIHDVQFNILERNGSTPEDWERGWKDVVYVPAMGSARVIMRFEDFADPEMPYMYHCHLLMHEDEGMMGQFLVVDPNGVNENTSASGPLLLWPNPWVAGDLWLDAQDDELASALITDATGREVIQVRVPVGSKRWNIHLPELAPGVYNLTTTGSHPRKAKLLIAAP